MSHLSRRENVGSDRWISESLRPTRLVWETGVVLSPLGNDRPSTGASDAPTGSFPGLLLSHDGSPPGVVLDFGRELHGGVAFRVGTASPGGPVRVRIRFGESVTEAMGQALCQQVCSVEPGRTYELGATGFRFVRFDLLDDATFARLDHVRALLVCRDLEFKGAFRCSDERLNRIWQAGADTVRLCLQSHLWDGVKRDRQVWVADMHPAVMAVNAVFGELAVVRESLDLVRDETPPTQWMNGISAYSIWWILIHRGWYLHHGDRAFLERQRGYLRGLLDHLTSRIDGEGRECLDGWRFLDWGSCGDDAAIHAGMQALLVLGLEAGAELFEDMGEPDRAMGCREAVARLRRHVPAGVTGKHALALLVLAGFADARVSNREILGRDPCRGLTPFSGYSVLQARAQAGDIEGCLELLRRYWGAMLDLGATTFWEDFDPAWAEGAVSIDRLVPEGYRDVHADGGRFFHQAGPQPLPCLVGRADRVAERQRPGDHAGRNRVSGDSGRATPGRSGLGRGKLSHAPGRGPGATRERCRREGREPGTGD